MKRYVTKAELLSLQTNERRKLAALKLQRQAELEKKRYDEVLEKRRERQKYATEKYQRIPARRFSSGTHRAVLHDSAAGAEEHKVKASLHIINARPHSLNVSVTTIPRKLTNSLHQYIFTPTPCVKERDQQENTLNLSRSRELFIKTLMKHERQQDRLLKKSTNQVEEKNESPKLRISDVRDNEQTRVDPTMSTDSLNENISPSFDVVMPVRDDLNHKHGPSSVIPRIQENIDVLRCPKGMKNSLDSPDSGVDKIVYIKPKSGKETFTGETSVVNPICPEQVASVVYPISPVMTQIKTQMTQTPISGSSSPRSGQRLQPKISDLFYSASSQIASPYMNIDSKISQYLEIMNKGKLYNHEYPKRGSDVSMPNSQTSHSDSFKETTSGEWSSKTSSITTEKSSLIARYQNIELQSSLSSLYSEPDHSKTTSEHSTASNSQVTEETDKCSIECKSERRSPPLDYCLEQEKYLAQYCKPKTEYNVTKPVTAHDFKTQTVPFKTDASLNENSVTIDENAKISHKGLQLKSSSPVIVIDRYPTIYKPLRSKDTFTSLSSQVNEKQCDNHSQTPTLSVPPKQTKSQEMEVKNSSTQSHIPIPLNMKSTPLRGILRKNHAYSPPPANSFQNMTIDTVSEANILAYYNAANNRHTPVAQIDSFPTNFIDPRPSSSSHSRHVRFRGLEVTHISETSVVSDEQKVDMLSWPVYVTGTTIIAGKQVAKVSPQVRSSSIESVSSGSGGSIDSTGLLEIDSNSSLIERSKRDDENNNQEVVMSKPPTGLKNHKKLNEEQTQALVNPCQNISTWSGKTYQEIYQTRKHILANQNQSKCRDVRADNHVYGNDKNVSGTESTSQIVIQQMNNYVGMQRTNEAANQTSLMQAPTNITKLNPSNRVGNTYFQNTNEPRTKNQVLQISDANGRPMIIYPAEYPANVNIRLDKTPTDEEINNLWSSVRTCLSRSSSENNLCHPSYSHDTENYQSDVMNHDSQRTIHTNYRAPDRYPGKNKSNSVDQLNGAQTKNYNHNAGKKSYPVLKVTLSDLQCNRSASAGSRPNLLQRQQQRQVSFAAQQSEGVPQQHTNTVGVQKQAWENDVSESMAAFLTAEELSDQGASDSMIETAMFETKRRPHTFDHNNTETLQAMSALSMEEQRLLQSISRLDHQMNQLKSNTTLLAS